MNVFFLLWIICIVKKLCVESVTTIGRLSSVDEIILHLISMDNDDESNSYTVNTMLWRKKEAILWQDLCRLASITGPPGLTLLVLHSPRHNMCPMTAYPHIEPVTPCASRGGGNRKPCLQNVPYKACNFPLFHV